MSVEGALRRLLGSVLTGAREASSYMEIASRARDPYKNGIGTTFFPGDVGGTFVHVPEAPTLLAQNRYLIRLGGWPIPPGRSARIQSFAQFVEIGCLTAGADGGFFPVKRQVITPNFSFTDGNVIFGIRVMPMPSMQEMLVDPLQPEGYSMNPYGVSTGILYKPPTTSFPGYRPLLSEFPGSGLGDLGIIHDLRSIWGQNKMYFNYTVDGPAQVVVFASIKQTDPDTRVRLPSDAPLDGLSIEDRFLLSYPQAKYTGVGASITMEIGPSLRTATFRTFYPDHSPETEAP